MGQKLAMQMSLDRWSFEESVFGFFAPCAAIAGLDAVVTHCGPKPPRLDGQRRVHAR